jgi:BNR repeat-like domain
MKFARRWMPFVLLVLLSCMVYAAEEPVPKAGGLARSLVVGKQGYFPVAVRLQDGRIAVVLRGGAGHLGIQGRLDMVFSDDNGRTWTPPTVVVDSPVDDRNPALGQARDGTLVVGFWRTARYDDQGKYAPGSDKPTGTWGTRSRDGGKTWSEPTEIDVAQFGWGSPFGKIVTMPNGTLLMAVYGGQRRKPGEKVQPDRDHSYIYGSADNGQSWKYLSEIGDGKQQLNETALLRLSSGKLMAALRSRAGDVWLSESTDDARTWSATKPLTPRSVHPADLIELDDGRVLLVVGNRVGPFGVLGLVSDRQQQFDWSRRFTLVDDALSGDCGYPSSVKLAGGLALTVYYATRAKEHPEWGVHCGAVVFDVPPPR